MITTALEDNAVRLRPSPDRQGRRSGLGSGLLLLGTLLLFLHGCHAGDEDHELFARLAGSLSASADER